MNDQVRTLNMISLVFTYHIEERHSLAEEVCMCFTASVFVVNYHDLNTLVTHGSIDSTIIMV